MNALTARQALDLLDSAPGEAIAVTGAAGAFGGCVVQLAKADGLRVVADTADRDRELVRSLGADVVVARGDDVAERIREAAPDGVAGIADGALLNDRLVPAVRDGGRISTARFFTAKAERGITYRPAAVREYAQEWEELGRPRSQVDEGVLSLRPARTYPAGEAAQAHRALEAGGVRGRLVLEF